MHNPQPQSTPRFITEDGYLERGRPSTHVEEQCRNCHGTGRVPYPGFHGGTESVTCGRCVGYRRVFVLVGGLAVAPAPAEPEPAVVDFVPEPADEREPTFVIEQTRPGVGSPYTFSAQLSIDPMALGREASTWPVADLAALLMGLASGLSDQELGNSTIAAAGRYVDEHLTADRDRGVLGNFAYVLGNNTRGIGSVAA